MGDNIAAIIIIIIILFVAMHMQVTDEKEWTSWSFIAVKGVQDINIICDGK